MGMESSSLPKHTAHTWYAKPSSAMPEQLPFFLKSLIKFCREQYQCTAFIRTNELTHGHAYTEEQTHRHAYTDEQTHRHAYTDDTAGDDVANVVCTASEPRERHAHHLTTLKKHRSEQTDGQTGDRVVNRLF